MACARMACAAPSGREAQRPHGVDGVLQRLEHGALGFSLGHGGDAAPRDGEGFRVRIQQGAQAENVAAKANGVETAAQGCVSANVGAAQPRRQKPHPVMHAAFPFLGAHGFPPAQHGGEVALQIDEQMAPQHARVDRQDELVGQRREPRADDQGVGIVEKTGGIVSHRIARRDERDEEHREAGREERQPRRRRRRRGENQRRRQPEREQGKTGDLRKGPEQVEQAERRRRADAPDEIDHRLGRPFVQGEQANGGNDARHHDRARGKGGFEPDGAGDEHGQTGARGVFNRPAPVEKIGIALDAARGSGLRMRQAEQAAFDFADEIGQPVGEADQFGGQSRRP